MRIVVGQGLVASAVIRRLSAKQVISKQIFLKQVFLQQVFAVASWFHQQVLASSTNGRKCVGSHAYTEYRHVAQSFALPICRRRPT
jgi:hypothetical protein